MSQDNLQQLQQRILDISDLPTLPSVAGEIINMIQNEDFSLKDIAAVMQRDPALTAKVLRLANSAGYGVRKEVETLNQAMMILGVNEIFNMVVGIAVVEVFKDHDSSDLFDLDAFWEHAIGTGEISRTLARKLGLRFMGAEFTGGLLHDMGKIIYDQFFHEEFNEALRSSRENRTPLWQEEKRIFGVDHAELGAWLARNWKLPERLVEVVEYHHRENDARVDPALVAVVSLADTFAKIAGIGFSGDKTHFHLPEHPSWKVLGEHVPALRDLDVVRFTYELEEDLERAREFAAIIHS